ncbi:hypothetical protein Esti_004459 [Eimeria stiedai]
MLPTLTDDAFLTEVHHLKEDGTSAGVVYSEMQAYERLAETVLNRELLLRLYPGDSGYTYETGGLMRWIRQTNNCRVRAYHKAFYKWENMALIASGSIPTNELLSVFDAAATKIAAAAAAVDSAAAASAAAAAAGHWEEFKKPLAFGHAAWTDPVNTQPLLESWRSVVRFPADDERTSRVAVAWRGPPWSAFQEREALDILGYYLCDSNISILEKELVQSQDPVCASVEFGTEAFKSTCLFIEAADVLQQQQQEQQQEQQGEAQRQGFAVAERILSLIAKEAEKGLDLNRLHALLRRELLQFAYTLETAPHSTCASKALFLLPPFPSCPFAAPLVLGSCVSLNERERETKRERTERGAAAARMYMQHL